MLMMLEVGDDRAAKSAALGTLLALAGIAAAFCGESVGVHGRRCQAFQKACSTVGGYRHLLFASTGAGGGVSLRARRPSAICDREGAESGEYYALVLFSLVGQCILSTANDLIMVFIGLEISSIATYILAGFLRNDRRNNEAALKYFLLGPGSLLRSCCMAWPGFTGVPGLPTSTRSGACWRMVRWLLHRW